MSPDFIPSQPEGVYLYPFLPALCSALGGGVVWEEGGRRGPLLPAMGLGFCHPNQCLPLRGFRYSKYREPEKVSCKPLAFCQENSVSPI